MWKSIRETYNQEAAKDGMNANDIGNEGGQENEEDQDDHQAVTGTVVEAASPSAHDDEKRPNEVDEH